MKEEPLDTKEEPIEIKEETSDIKEEPLDISEEIDYRFQTGVEAFEPLDEKNRYECLICETGFAQKKLLEQHNDAVHEEKKAFKCSVCDGHFDSERILKMHIFTVHGFMRGKDFLEKGV